MQWNAVRPHECEGCAHFAITIEMNLDLLVTERTVYSFLDFLGNIGGLYDGLRLIFGLVVAFWNYNFYNSFLINYLFRMD